MNYTALGLIRYISDTHKDSLGYDVPVYCDYAVLKGFIDYLSGNCDRQKFGKKTEINSYIFICEYTDLAFLKGKNCSMVIEDEIYDVEGIDNPLNLCHHLEIHLRKVE